MRAISAEWVDPERSTIKVTYLIGEGEEGDLQDVFVPNNPKNAQWQELFVAQLPIVDPFA